MSTETLVALTGIMAALVSAVTAVLVNRLQLRSERERLRRGHVHDVGSKLYDKRVEVFPELYGQLHVFYKEMRFGNLDRAAVDRMFAALDSWSMKNSIFLSEAADYASFWLYRSLMKLRELEPPELADLPHERLAEVGRLVIGLKLTLQGSIGSGPFVTPLADATFQLESSYADRDRRYQKLFESAGDPFQGGPEPMRVDARRPSASSRANAD